MEAPNRRPEPLTPDEDAFQLWERPDWKVLVVAALRKWAAFEITTFCAVAGPLLIAFRMPDDDIFLLGAKVLLVSVSGIVAICRLKYAATEKNSTDGALEP